MKTDTVSLKYEYNDHEKSELATEIARGLAKKRGLDADLTSVKKDFGAQIAACDAQIESLSNRINSGFEIRNVRCIQIDNRPTGFRILVRSDNGHVHRRRKLDESESQMTIDEALPPAYVAVAILRNDDPQWKVDGCKVPLLEDEFEALRQLPDVTMLPIEDQPKGLLE